MRLRRTLAVLLSVALLTSCARGGPIPPELLTLPERPSVPAPGASDNAVAGYILGMEAWAETAIRRMRAIREIVR
jgi:hypothetical protein